MAFGALKSGVLTGNANSITNPMPATGSCVVAVGDLIVAIFGEQTTLTTTTVTDNLGNTYAAVNAGTIGGAAVSGHPYYSYVTKPGTLTTVNAAATASGNNAAAFAAAFEGPFLASPLDAAPANNANTDNTTPFNCPTTPTLAQAAELVIGWMVGVSNATWLATAPNTKAGQATSQSLVNIILGYQTVAATTAVTPVFSGTNPTASVQGTMSFKQNTAYVPPHRMFAMW